MTGGTPAVPVWPARVEAVLLDAGGVLLDLDYGFVRRLVGSQVGHTEGIHLADEELAALEAHARREIHRHVEQGRRTVDAWRDYFHTILGRAGVPGPTHAPIIDALWEAHHRVGLWTMPVGQGPATVAELKRRGYRLGVVSNAEGRVAQDLEAAGYRGVFDTVIDSHVVGVEKPDPAIFHLALERLGVAAAASVYVGDVPSVDVDGARAAGIAPVLLDRHGIYPDTDVRRVRSLGELLADLPGAAS